MSPIAGASPESAKKRQASAFDAMGAVNNKENKDFGYVQSFALPLDLGSSIPVGGRNSFMSTAISTTPVSVNIEANKKPGFWGKVFNGMEKTYNFATQAIAFGLTFNDSDSPMFKGGFDAGKIKETWDKAHDISFGQAVVTQGLGKPISAVDNVFSGVAKKVSGGKLTGTDKFIQDHMLFASSKFDLYDEAQRKEAFGEQVVGKATSFTTDVIGRFYIDPFLVGGKALKVYRAGKFAVEGTKGLDAILTGEKTGFNAKRVKATFNDFIEGTDDMTQADLFRIKAIRESANPGAFAELLAQANKIENKATRHAAKADLVHMAMGDASAAERLMQTDRLLAAKIGSLQDDVAQAKYLGEGVDKATGQLTMDLANNGVDVEKASELIDEFSGQVDEIYQKLSAEAILDPNIVPSIDLTSKVRNFVWKSDNIPGSSMNFIDIRSGGGGLAGTTVRVLTKFAFKRPKGWIDFTDNQSVQTLDNMLSRVKGITEEQNSRYITKISELEKTIALLAKDPATNAKAIKELQKESKLLKRDYESAIFTKQKRDELFARYTGAADPYQRAEAFAEIEEYVFNTVARQFGYDEAAVKQAYNLFNAGRYKARNLLTERSYSGAVDPATGEKVGSQLKPIVGAEDLNYVVPLPLNETQLAKSVPVLDIDTMYKALQRHTRANRFDKVGKIYRSQSATTARNLGSDLVDGLDNLIKFEVLARIGYPVRNVTEGSMRILTTVGPMALLTGISEGSRNLFAKGLRATSADEVFKWSNEVKLSAHRDMLDSLLDTADNPAAIQAQIDEINDMLSGTVKVKDKFGLGLNEVTVNGKVVRYEDALGATPRQAEAIKDMFISNAAKIVDDHFKAVSTKMSQQLELTGDWVTITGKEQGYVESYLRVVNRQIKGSEITKRLLAGDSVDDVERWLLTDKEGRRILRRLAMGRDARGIVEANLDNLNHVFPSWTGTEFRKIAAERNITAKDIEKYLGLDADKYPQINAAQIGIANGTNPFTRAYSKTLENFYNLAGELPESTFVRHPLFVDLYRKRMDATIAQAIETYPGDVIPPEYIRKLESSARQWARAEMRRTLYDTAERVDAAYTLKYIFPFFGAFADVAEKWGKIVVKDPAVLRKIETIYDSPDRMGMVEERDGKKYINIPGEWTKRMGIDRPLSIPKASLNLIFQGGAWWNPGAGWFVQFAASNLIKAVPPLEQTKLIKEILPYGPDGTGFRDLVLQSAGARKVLAMFDENDQMRTNLTVLIAAEENHKFDAGLRATAPTAKEINERVLKTLAMEAASRFTLPFATNTRSPYQFYIDEYHKLREEDPENAAEKFYEKYGDDYYIFSTSLSRNNTGIAATVDANKRSKELADLIAEQPELGWFIVGDANAGEFSPTVYALQREQAVAPGSTTKFRSKQDPYTAIKETNANKGWIEYNKGMDIIEAERIRRGLKSLQSKGAEDLKVAKDRFVAELEGENPDWAEVRGKIDTNKVNNFLKFAAKMVMDPRLEGRPDIQVMRDYLEGREYIRQALAGRESKSLDNAGNTDIKETWDTFIGQLIDENTAFNRVYTRMLEKDDLRKGL